ncbi:MAG TPA: PIN domain-containing protein [Phycisphaerales bacterium]|nr:PIN domain-containing protein [Phycisphaerales bacterium]
MADTFTVVFDACIFYPFTLRDLFVQLATTDLFRGRWTSDIHDEWTRALLAAHPGDARLTAERLAALRDRIDENVLDCVVTGYERLIPGLQLPDPDDRHVLAAAIRSGAQVIVTKNIRDFPEEALAPFGIEAQHPDAFVACLLDLSAGTVCQSVREVRLRYKHPPADVEAYMRMLERQDLFETAARLREYGNLI